MDDIHYKNDDVIDFKARMYARIGASMEKLWRDNAGTAGDKDASSGSALDPDTAAIIEAEAQIVMSQWMLYRAGVDTDENPLEAKAIEQNSRAELRLAKTPVRTREAAAAVARFLESAVKDIDPDGHHVTAIQNLRDWLEGGARSFNPHCEL